MTSSFLLSGSANESSRSSANELHRVIALVDMDCFYVAVEQKLNPDLKGKPTAVVQYQAWRGGGIIAVSYEARAFGVTRSMRGDDAKEVCPNIHLCRVEESRGKANLTKYREASAEVMSVMKRFSDSIERASIDEAYIDLTAAVDVRIKDSLEVDPSKLPTTFVAGFGGEDIPKDVQAEDREERRKSSIHRWLLETTGSTSDHRLAIGALLVEEMRSAVAAETSFNCSAGISHSKMFAKYACGMNKPNRQTVLPIDAGRRVLFPNLPLKNLRNLGGKLGSTLADLGCVFVADLTRFSRAQLVEKFGDRIGLWLFNVGRGLDNEVVTPRSIPKSIGCSKNFRGPQALDTKEKVRHWLGELVEELVERLDKDKETNNRVAKLCTASISGGGGRVSAANFHASRVFPISLYKGQKIASDAFNVLSKLNEAATNSPQWIPPVVNLGISASKFEDTLGGGGGIVGSKSSIKDLLLRAASSKNSGASTFRGDRGKSSVIHAHRRRDHEEEEELDYDDGECAIDALSTLIGDEEEESADEIDRGYSDATIVENVDSDGEDGTDSAEIGCFNDVENDQTAPHSRQLHVPPVQPTAPPPPSPSSNEDDFSAVISRWRKSKDKRRLAQGLASLRHISQISTEIESRSCFFGDFFVKNFGEKEEEEEGEEEEKKSDVGLGGLSKGSTFFEVPSTSKRTNGKTFPATKAKGPFELMNPQASSTKSTVKGRETATMTTNSTIDDAFLSQIDPTILGELPPEIQSEIHEALQRRRGREKEAPDRPFVPDGLDLERESLDSSRKRPATETAADVTASSSQWHDDHEARVVREEEKVVAPFPKSNRISGPRQFSEEDLFDDDKRTESEHEEGEEELRSSTSHDVVPMNADASSTSSLSNVNLESDVNVCVVKGDMSSPQLLRVRCDVCDEMVDVLQADEHRDFHFAADLQKEIRKNDVIERRARREMSTTTKNSPLKRDGGGNVVGRGRGRGRGKKETKAAQGSGNIKNFFS